MSYCPKCGSLLVDKELKGEGVVPFCPTCNEFRFPTFNVAVSMIIVSEDNNTLFIKQYNTGFNRLVAGYVNKGESLEHAVVREMAEEVGLRPIQIRFLKSAYYLKTNTLLNNFLCLVDTEDVHKNYEVDSYGWYNIEDALPKLEGSTLAKEFYRNYIENY